MPSLATANPHTKTPARQPGGLLLQAGRKGFANGGRIQGPGTPTSDSIPAQVTQTGEPIQVATGERIVSAEQDKLLERIAKAMGHASVDEMLMAGTGKPVGPTLKYAKGHQGPVRSADLGGVFGALKSAVGIKPDSPELAAYKAKAAADLAASKAKPAAPAPATGVQGGIDGSSGKSLDSRMKAAGAANGAKVEPGMLLRAAAGGLSPELEEAQKKAMALIDPSWSPPAPQAAPVAAQTPTATTPQEAPAATPYGTQISNAFGAIPKGIAEATKYVVSAPGYEGTPLFGDKGLLTGTSSTAAPTAAAPAAAAPALGNQTAATAARTGLPLNSRVQQGATGDVRNHDFSSELNGAQNALPASLPDNKVFKTTDAQGRTTYSGNNVGVDANGQTQMVDGMGRNSQMLNGGSGNFAYSVDAAGKRNGPQISAFSDGQNVSSAGGVNSGGGGSFKGGPGMSSSGGDPNFPALMAAMQRGDTDAVQQYYADKGQSFRGVSAEDYLAKKKASSDVQQAAATDVLDRMGMPKPGERGYRDSQAAYAKTRESRQQAARDSSISEAAKATGKLNALKTQADVSASAATTAGTLLKNSAMQSSADTQAKLQALHDSYGNASPAARPAIAEQIRIMTGKEQAPKYTALNMPDTVGPNGEVLRGGQVALDSNGRAIDVRAQGARQAAPPTGHIAALQADPKLAADFDAKYGAGASAAYLTKK